MSIPIQIEAASAALYHKLKNVVGFITIGYREKDNTLIVYVDKSKNRHVFQSIPDQWYGYKVTIKAHGEVNPTK